MHLPRSIFLSALVAVVATTALARADVTLETTVLDPETKGGAPTLQVTVIGATPGELGSYSLKQGDKATAAIKASKLVPFLEGPDAIGMVVVVLADGNWLANQGRSDIGDSVQAAFASLAAAGPKGSQVSVVTYAEGATDPSSIGGATLASSGSEGGWQVQVSSFKTQVEADAFATQLRARGHKAHVQKAEIPKRGTWYRVKVGPFSTQVEAIKYRQAFEAKEKMPGFVVKSGELH